MPKKVHCPLCFTLTDLAWLAQHGQNVQIVSINMGHFLNQIQMGGFRLVELIITELLWSKSFNQNIDGSGFNPNWHEAGRIYPP